MTASLLGMLVGRSWNPVKNYQDQRCERFRRVPCSVGLGVDGVSYPRVKFRFENLSGLESIFGKIRYRSAIHILNAVDPRPAQGIFLGICGKGLNS